jgi:hypothetical protein
MDHWWERKKFDKGDYSEIEDLTGCIPLLLEDCLKNGKINLSAKEMKDVWNEAASFVKRVRKYPSAEDWETYATLLEF